MPLASCRPVVPLVPDRARPCPPPVRRPAVQWRATHRAPRRKIADTTSGDSDVLLMPASPIAAGLAVAPAFVRQPVHGDAANSLRPARRQFAVRRQRPGRSSDARKPTVGPPHDAYPDALCLRFACRWSCSGRQIQRAAAAPPIGSERAASGTQRTSRRTKIAQGSGREGEGGSKEGSFRPYAPLVLTHGKTACPYLAEPKQASTQKLRLHIPVRALTDGDSRQQNRCGCNRLLRGVGVFGGATDLDRRSPTVCFAIPRFIATAPTRALCPEAWA
jgi:hypothetical protein